MLSLPGGRVLTVVNDEIRILDQAGNLVSSRAHGSSHLSASECHAADGMVVLREASQRVVIAQFDYDGQLYVVFAATASFPLLSASLSHDNAFLFLGGPNGQVAFVDMASRQETWRLTSWPQGWVFQGRSLFDAPQQS